MESTVEHVILTVVCSLDEDIRDDMSGYMLRVRLHYLLNYFEYLDSVKFHWNIYKAVQCK